MADFVTRTLACPSDTEFADCLEGCLAKWPFPKSDLFHWTTLLDRFDETLARVIEAHWEEGTRLQKDLMTEVERRLTTAILQFTRLLLENCSSRNIYCSYDRLKRLLVTNHADILERTLELLLIPARKLDSQGSLRNTFEREVGTDELAIIAQLSLPFIPEMGELEEAKFALRFRNHHAERLSQGGSYADLGSQYVKMLATAIFLMAQPEGSVDSAFFAMSPTLVADTARLVTPSPGPEDWRVQLAALSILRSCLKSGARSTEILHALQLGASHGPIASIFRLLVDAMITGKEFFLPVMFVYGYLDFVAVLATQVDIDDSFVNSGIVSEAVRAIDAADSRYYKVVEKALYILDALIHHYVSAIDFFFANNGLMTIVKQTVRYIELGGARAKDTSAGNHSMLHSDAIILQCLLRFIDKLLNTNGADDRLRNLLEGPLFRSMAMVFEAGSEGFSPEIIAHAISIVAAFIHNEPTALTVLQEVGTPQALTQSVKRCIPAVAELIGKIPHAFSAVCLNPAGTEYFAQVDPVTTLCSLFLQTEYLKILRSRGTASSLGGAMDEFIRHHPQFRPVVLRDVVGTLKQIPSTIETLRSCSANADLFASCDLLPVKVDELMSSSLGQAGEKRTEPVLSLMTETISSFIEGLVQTPTHAKEFIELGGVQALMEVFYSGGISYDFTIYNESLSISHMLRLLSDVDGDHVISAILRSLVRHTTAMDAFIGQVRPTSVFASTLREGSMVLSEQNSLFQSLTGTLAVIGLLRDLYVTHSYTYARLGGALLRGFTSKEGEAALVFLSILLKVCSWEFGQLMQALDQSAAAALLVRAKMDFKSPVFQSFSTAVYQFSEGRALQGLSDDMLRERAGAVPTGQCKNTLYLCFTLQRLLTCISAVFSGLAKLLSSRSIVIDAGGSAKLVGIIANSGINALNWLTQEGQEVPLRLRSFLMTHVMQFLPVIFFDDASSRPSLMQPVLKAFVDLQGNDDLVKAIQRYMLASVTSYNVGDESDPEDVRAAVKEIVHFLARLSSPAFRINDVDDEDKGKTSFLDDLRHMVALYCIEFLSLPMGFRRQLGAGVIGEVLLCMAALVQVKGKGSHLAEFRFQVFEKFQEIALQSLEASPETIVEVSTLMKALTKPKLCQGELSGINNDEEDEDNDETAAASSGDEDSGGSSLRHGHTMESIISIYGWLMRSGCPLPGAVRWRLLAAAINSPSRRYIYPLVVEALPTFVDAIEVSRSQGDLTALASSILLVAEVVFMSTLPIAGAPLSEYQGLPGEGLPSENLETFKASKPVVSSEVLTSLTKMAAAMCCDTTQSNLDVDLSVLYLLAALTRRPETHEHFELEKLVSCLSHRSTECLTSRDKRYRSMATLSTLILRHLIETPSYMGVLMQTEVLTAFPTSTNSRNKIKSFVSTGNMEFALCRDFYAFRTTVAKHYGLIWDYPPKQNACWANFDLTARKNIPSDQGEAEVPQTPSLAELQDETLSPRAGQIIAILMEQLLAKTNDFPPQESPEANEQAESNDTLVFAHFERCAILVNIVELIHSYPVCREAFLKSPRITLFLAFLLERMTPSGELAGTLGSRLFVNESMWVSQLLDEICVGPLQVPPAERMTRLPDRVNTIVDALDASLKQFISSSSGIIETYPKMSRAWCLIMTVYVLLSIKSTSPASTGLGRLLSPVQSAVTARMLEKGIMASLSTILRSIDRSAPMAPIVAAKIIFSMEILARLGNKLARLTSGGAAGGDAANLASLVAGELGSMSEDFDEAEMGMEMDMMEMDDEEESSEDEDDMDDVDVDELDEGEFDDEGEDDTEGEMEMEMEIVGTSDDQMLSGYSTGSEGAMSEGDTTDEDDDDMIDMDDDDDDEGVVRLVVQPPIGSGPATDAVASGFQVIPFDSSAGMGAIAGGTGSFASAAFLGAGADHHHNVDEEFITEEDESMDEEAFSVDDEADEDEEDEDEDNEADVDYEHHGFGHIGGSETIFDDGLVMSLQPRLGTIRRRFVGGLGDGFPLGGRTSYSSQLRADAGTDIFSHPLIAPRLSQTNAMGSRTYSFDTSRLPGLSAAASSVNSTGGNKEYLENQDVFHSPHIITTIRRWSQECRLFIGDDSGVLAKESIEAALLGPGSPLLEEAQERHGRALADYEARVERESEESKRRQQAQEEEARGRQNEKEALLSTETPMMTVSESSPSQSRSQQELVPSALSPAAPATNISSGEPTYYEDMGPDRDFLEALPFEMRREVLEQYFEERRRNIPDGAQVQINADFLASLSADLRADYERLSALEAERFRRRAGHRLIGQMDIAALLQNMGPDVQRALLEAVETDLTDDDAVRRITTSTRNTASSNTSEQVASLISALSESMRRLRESGATAASGSNNGGRSTGLTSAPRDSATSSSVALPRRDYANMIDTTSLATILRVFYDPLMTEHRTHMKLFLHLCSGPATRADLLNMLIFILEESPEDSSRLDTVLETFITRKGTASLASLGPGGKGTPKPTPKKIKSPVTPGKSTTANTSDPFGGATHVVIQQRSMQLLMQLVQHNDDARKFFITPYEAPWTIKRHDKRTNKTIVVSTKFPIVLLLACLERTNFVQIPLLVENLLHLLQLVSAPLKDSASEPPLEIPTPFISSMVRATVHCELGPKAFQYATQVFQNFSLLEPVANVIVGELAEMSIRLALSTISEVRSLTTVVAKKSKTSINETLKGLGAASSHQCKLLRAMKILSSTILKPLKAEEDRMEHRGFDALITAPPINWTPIKEAANKSAWTELFAAIDECLRALGGDSELFHVATGLLPAIESQFWHLRQAFVLEASMKTAEEERLLNFSDVHRVLLNTMIRSNPNLLTTGAFILLTRMPRTLDFDNKRSWFRQNLVKRGVSRPSLSVHVRRAHVFEDSFHAIMGRSGDEIKYGRLSIKFHDEEGLDAGGVTREWFSVLSRQMFDPNYALFKISAVDKITYQPNRMSYINPDHLQYFAFIGRIIGKAIYDNRLLDCYFTRSFYKHILGIPVDFKDLEAADPEFYKSLVWILENDITDVMEMTFSLEVDEFGSHKIIDLIPDGRSVPVTEANKREYVRLVTECKLTTAIKPQIDAFLRGFHEIIPESLIAIFNEQELELLISGMPDIDVDDWRNNTEYSGYTVSSPTIHWFWRTVRSFDQEYRAKLLQFVTGTSKVPLDGFASLQGSNGVQKFQIHRDYGANTRLPSAHTCFNQLDLPEYESYEQLREMLIKAINECGTGFGLV